MIMQDSQTRRIVEVLIHIIGWGIVFAFPFPDDMDENFYNPASLGVLHNHVTKIINFSD